MSRLPIAVGTCFFLKKPLKTKSYSVIISPMNRILLKRYYFVLFAAVLMLFSAGCKSNEVKPAESPEEVVKKFYAYIKEGGPTTLNEAYRMCDLRPGTLEEGRFKDTVSKYPKDLEVKILGTTIDEKKDIAVVSIECRTASSFGGYMTTSTDLNLSLDREAKAWKIDFAGDTYEETPASYGAGGK